jgi:hypothetical protein
MCFRERAPLYTVRLIDGGNRFPQHLLAPGAGKLVTEKPGQTEMSGASGGITG